MLTNPGGRLDPAEIIGRDREIARYWRILARQSLLLGGERRIGKSHIAWKMRAYAEEGFVVFYQDLEKVHSGPELVRSIYTTVDEYLSATEWLKARAQAFAALLPRRIGSIDTPDPSVHWRSLLESAISDVLDAVGSDHKTVFVWDEFPLMLYNLAREGRPDDAIQLLDLLRSLRLEHAARLRFLFTGSIGMHLVLRSLRLAGNANAPMNDVFHDAVHPMDTGEMLQLARRLLADSLGGDAAIEELAQAVCDTARGFPFHAHLLVDRLTTLDHAASVADVGDAARWLIDDPQDPAQFAYGVERIRTYYTKEEQAIALAILDAMAGKDMPLAMENLINLARHAQVDLRDEQVREVCALLHRDHYIAPRGDEDETAWDFVWPIVKRWWRRNRL